VPRSIGYRIKRLPYVGRTVHDALWHCRPRRTDLGSNHVRPFGQFIADRMTGRLVLTGSQLSSARRSSLPSSLPRLAKRRHRARFSHCARRTPGPAWPRRIHRCRCRNGPRGNGPTRNCSSTARRRSRRRNSWRACFRPGRPAVRRWTWPEGSSGSSGRSAACSRPSGRRSVAYAASAARGTRCPRPRSSSRTGTTRSSCRWARRSPTRAPRASSTGRVCATGITRCSASSMCAQLSRSRKRPKRLCFLDAPGRRRSRVFR
jgi:hypothetical protein